MKIHMLKAEYGDSFLISTKNDNDIPVHILVDGGTRRTYDRALKHALSEIIERKEQLDIIIVTHVDEDHISGILALFQDTAYIRLLHPKLVLYNYFDLNLQAEKPNNKISYRQGDMLSSLLNQYNCQEADQIEVLSVTSGQSLNYNGIEIDILSPLAADLRAVYQDWEKKENQISCKEDDYHIPVDCFADSDEPAQATLPNKSSIACIISCQSHCLLMMGDAPADIISQQLLKRNGDNGPIRFSAVKLSHHGGENSISNELLQLIDCDTFLISTNGKRYKHPRKRTLVRIVRQNANAKLYLNYKRDVFTAEEIKRYGIHYYEEIDCLNL